MFELQCYEYMDCYDGDMVTSDQAVAAFVAMCRRHVDPRRVLQKHTEIDIGTLFMAYKDKSGNDKPKLVLLMGPLTQEMKSEAQAALAAMYTQECSWYIKGGGTCKTVVPLGGGLCKPCHKAMCAEE